MDTSAFIRIVITLCDLLTEVHGQLTMNSIEVSRYASHVNDLLIAQSKTGPRFKSTATHQPDLILCSSDNILLDCNREVLCRIPYFDSLLHGGFRESLQQERVSVDIHSSILRLVLVTIESGRLPDLPVGRLLDTYIVFDYLQSDDLLHAFDQQLRMNFLHYTRTCLDDLLCEISPAILQRILPLLVQDMTHVFGMQGYGFLLRFVLQWLEVGIVDLIAVIIIIMMMNIMIIININYLVHSG